MWTRRSRYTGPDLNVILSAANERGWMGCGDLCPKGWRQSWPFKRLSDEQRFALSYVISESGCWDWVGSKKAANGYGQFRYRGRNCNVHRVAYEIFVGPIPEDLTIDHKCRNKGCVNPDHMETVTGAENIRRWSETVVTCPAGHPYTSYRRRGFKECRVCHNERTSIDHARRQIVTQAQFRRRTRLLDEDIAEMRALRGNGMRVKDIAGMFGVTPKYASAVIAGSRQRRRVHTGPDTATRRLIEARSGGRCEFPGCLEAGTQDHHRKPRRSGGSRDPRLNHPANLLRLCLDHHQWTELNRQDAYELGLLLHAPEVPSLVPVQTVHDELPIFLLDDGSVSLLHGQGREDPTWPVTE